MYYLAKSALKWDDEDFWDSSPRFLFKQMDLYTKYNKRDEHKSSVKNNDKNAGVNTTIEKKKLGIISP